MSFENRLGRSLCACATLLGTRWPAGRPGQSVLECEVRRELCGIAANSDAELHRREVRIPLSSLESTPLCVEFNLSIVPESLEIVVVLVSVLMLLRLGVDLVESGQSNSSEHDCYIVARKSLTVCIIRIMRCMGGTTTMPVDISPFGRWPPL